MVVWYSIKCLGRGHPVSEAETITAEDAGIGVQLTQESPKRMGVFAAKRRPVLGGQ